MVSFKALSTFLCDVRIAHHIRGRIRLKLEGRATSIGASRVDAGAFQALLDRTPGVRSVQVNLLARSCTIQYDPEVIPEQAWADYLAGTASEAAAVLERILCESYREIGNAELR